ncbi:MAG: TM2 domain-containing membrane protein YozV [Halieaceae bacterium]|jgi:TM2 domain-containing membrane protein YozV
MFIFSFCWLVDSLGNTIAFQNTHETHITLDRDLVSSFEFVQVSSVSPSVNIKANKPKSKAVAIALAATLGVFGVHRLYLGTANKVPIIYTLTLGGGFGLLMVSDIVAIVATKDINTFSPSEKVFMWAK